MGKNNIKKAAVAAFAGVALAAAAVVPALAAPSISADAPAVGAPQVQAPAPGPLPEPDPKLEPKPELKTPVAKPKTEDEKKDPEAPKAELSVSPDSGCLPLKVKLDASKSHGEIVNYHFTYPGGGGGSKSATYEAELKTAGSGVVGVEVSGPEGRDSITKKIDLKPADDPSCKPPAPAKPRAALDVTPDSGCGPLTVHMDASGSTGEITDYKFVHEGTTDGPGAASGHDVVVHTPGNQTLSVIVTGPGGSDTASRTVFVRYADDEACIVHTTDAPVAHPRGWYLPVCDATTVDLDGTASTGDIVAFDWDLDQNGTIDASGSRVTHTFGVGTHRVRLTVTDNRGRTSTGFLQDIVVNPCSHPADPVYYAYPNFAG